MLLLSSPRPLYPNEVKYSAFAVERIFHSHANKIHFHKKVCNWPHFESEGFWNSEVAYSEALARSGASMK